MGNGNWSSTLWKTEISLADVFKCFLWVFFTLVGFFPCFHHGTQFPHSWHNRQGHSAEGVVQETCNEHVTSAMLLLKASSEAANTTVLFLGVMHFCSKISPLFLKLQPRSWQQEHLGSSSVLWSDLFPVMWKSTRKDHWGFKQLYVPIWHPKKAHLT